MSKTYRYIAFAPTILMLAVIGYSIIDELADARQFERSFEASQAKRAIVDGQKSATDADVAAIEDLYRSTLASWCAGNGNSYGAAFTESAIYIGFDGSVTKGKRQIGDSHQ